MTTGEAGYPEGAGCRAGRSHRIGKAVGVRQEGEAEEKERMKGSPRAVVQERERIMRKREGEGVVIGRGRESCPKEEMWQRKKKEERNDERTREIQ